MSTLVSVWDFLAGKKTYIAALLLAVHGLVIGDTQEVLQALAVFGLRNAL